MKAAELRQSILQAAVQGKLVPQNLQDKPACELFERIQNEKAHLIKEGKIKKPLPCQRLQRMRCRSKFQRTGAGCDWVN